MTLRTILMIGAVLMILLLLGVGYYAMILQPSKYRRPRVWLIGATCLFLLYAVGIISALGQLDLKSMMAVLVFGVPASILTALGLWIPLFQRDKITEWLGSRRQNNSKP
jgi:hypothetical protein